MSGSRCFLPMIANDAATNASINTSVSHLPIFKVADVIQLEQQIVNVSFGSDCIGS